MADRAWDVPAAGGTVPDRWPDIAAAIASRLPDHVQAVAFHPETGQLDLRPDSPAYATQLRLISARIVAAANEAVHTDAVRSVRVLAVGAAPVSRTVPETAVAPDTPPAPVKTREMAAPGFHQALAAHRAVAPPSRIAPSIAEAVERQTAAMRVLSFRAFPESEAAADDQSAPIEQVRAERRRQASGRPNAAGRADQGPGGLADRPRSAAASAVRRRAVR